MTTPLHEDDRNPTLETVEVFKNIISVFKNNSILLLIDGRQYIVRESFSKYIISSISLHTETTRCYLLSDILFPLWGGLPKNTMDGCV